MQCFPPSLIFLTIFIHSAISGRKFSFQADELVLLQFKEGSHLEIQARKNKTNKASLTGLEDSASTPGLKVWHSILASSLILFHGQDFLFLFHDL